MHLHTAVENPEDLVHVSDGRPDAKVASYILARADYLVVGGQVPQDIQVDAVRLVKDVPALAGIVQGPGAQLDEPISLRRVAEMREDLSTLLNDLARLNLPSVHLPPDPRLRRPEAIGDKMIRNPVRDRVDRGRKVFKVEISLSPRRRRGQFSFGRTRVDALVL
jgi:hypothetical protein